MSVDAQHREQVLAAAVQEGRILARGVPKWRLFYDADAAATERTLRDLEPVAAYVPSVAMAPDLTAALAEARAHFPELARRRGRGRARAVRSD